jgi:hypothetical protein
VQVREESIRSGLEVRDKAVRDKRLVHASLEAGIEEATEALFNAEGRVVDKKVEIAAIKQILRLRSMMAVVAEMNGRLRVEVECLAAETDRHCRSHNIAAECCVWSVSRASTRGVAGSEMVSIGVSMVWRRESGEVRVE